MTFFHKKKSLHFMNNYIYLKAFQKKHIIFFTRLWYASLIFFYFYLKLTFNLLQLDFNYPVKKVENKMLRLQL